MEFFEWLKGKGRLTHTDFVEMKKIISGYDQVKGDGFVKDTLSLVAINRFLSDKYPQYSQEFDKELKEETRQRQELELKIKAVCPKCGPIDPIRDRCCGCGVCLKCHKRDYPPDGKECADCGYSSRNDD